MMKRTGQLTPNLPADVQLSLLVRDNYLFIICFSSIVL